jgi:hypothetical protein
VVIFRNVAVNTQLSQSQAPSRLCADINKKKSCASATPIAGAQHAAPAAHDYTATRPRTEEIVTKIDAAAAVAPAMPGRVAASGGQVELTEPANWDSMSRKSKAYWKKKRAKYK